MVGGSGVFVQNRLVVFLVLELPTLAAPRYEKKRKLKEKINPSPSPPPPNLNVYSVKDAAREAGVIIITLRHFTSLKSEG